MKHKRSAFSTVTMLMKRIVAVASPMTGRFWPTSVLHATSHGAETMAERVAHAERFGNAMEPDQQATSPSGLTCRIGCWKRPLTAARLMRPVVE